MRRTLDRFCGRGRRRVGVYGGYFGAGAGVIMLAVLAVRTSEPLAVTNAVHNVATSTANLVTAIAYAGLAPVDWFWVDALGAGALVGGWIGPQIVRVLPERPLRWGIAIAGLGLAAYCCSEARPRGMRSSALSGPRPAHVANRDALAPHRSITRSTASE